MGANSHGFGLSRTLSCADATKRNSHKEAQKTHMGSDSEASAYFGSLSAAGERTLWLLCLVAIYLRTVTLRVPMLPLESKVRSEIVCSPGPRAAKSRV